VNLLPIGFKFIALLIVIGGIIAVIADEVGRKLGKKRLSLFGLRPKHTARVGTFLMGVVVTIFTVLTVSGMSRGVRQWITQGDQAIVERDQKVRQLQQTEFQLRNVQNRYLKDQSQIREFEHQIDLQKKSLTEQRAHLDELNTRQAELQRRIDNTNRNYSETLAKLSTNQKLLADNQSQLQEVKILRKGAVVDLNESRKHALELQIKNQALQKEIAQQTSDLAALQTQKQDLERQQDNLKSELNTASTALSHVYDEEAAEVDHLNQLRKEEEDAIIQNLVGPSRVNPMIFGIGQEVARLGVPDHLTRGEAENAFDRLLKNARTEAEARGARSDAQHLVADIYKRDGLTPKQWREKLVDQLTGKDSSQVAIAVSYANAFQGEHLALIVDIRENPRVFKNGEIVAESPINGSRSLGDIYGALQHFLTNDVQTRAKERKMIPVDADLGAVSADQVLQTVQAIKSANRPVRLEAVAIGDIYAADPLKLDLQVR
jgi:uncharacterized protein (DUF3084 family)